MILFWAWRWQCAEITNAPESGKLSVERMPIVNQDSDPNPFASRPISKRLNTSEQTRANFFTLESTFRSWGIVFFLASLLFFLGGILLAARALESVLQRIQPVELDLFLIGVGIGFTGVAWYLFIIGERLRSLSPKARTPAITISVLGLLAFPLGTLASIYMLCLLVGERGQFIFSAEYKTVQLESTQFKYQQTGLAWFKAIVILFFYAVGVALLVSIVASLIAR